MLWVIEDCSWSEHLTAMSVTTVYMNAGEVGGLDPDTCWDWHEASVKQLIAALIPDSTFNQVKLGLSTKDVWKKLKQLYEGHTEMMMTNLSQRSGSTKCGEEDNIHTHFQTLSDLREQLASMGKNITDHKYASILFGSLLLTYEVILHRLNAAAHLTKTSVMPDAVICLATDEYNCRVVKKGHKSNNEAFMVITSQNKRKKRDIECHNCHKKGHIKAECWAKGGGKEGQGPRRGSMARGSMTAATAETNIEVWALIDECTDTESKSSHWVKDSDTSYWAEDSEDQDEVWATLKELKSDKEDQLVAAAGRLCTSTVEVELYDSGASHHMSPSCDKFSSYRSIKP
jgi:hypothetical protein